MGVEGSLCNCIQEVRVLGKVAVVALGANLIVLLHSSGKGCRLHTDVLGQLFDGVGAVPAVGALGTSSLCGLKVALHGFHHSGHVVLECLMAGEAAQDLGLIGAVVDGGDIAALCTCHEEAVDLRAGKGFVLEALAILVHPQGAGQIVGHGHGVEVHGGDVALQTAACPHTHLDGGAVAAKGSKEVLILGEQTLDVRQQIVHHFLVAAKAAACQHNAILSVDLEIIAVAVLCDHAGDLCTVHYQLHTLGAKQSGGIVREILLHIIVVVPAQVLQLQLTGGVVVLLAAGGVLTVVLPPFQRAGVVVHAVVQLVHGVLVVRPELDAGLGQRVRVDLVQPPVHSAAAVLGKLHHQCGVCLAVGLHHPVVHKLHFVHLGHTVAQQVVRVDVADIVADRPPAFAGHSFQHQNVLALFGQLTVAAQAGIAHTDDGNVNIVGLGDLTVRDGFRGGAPAGSLLRSFRGRHCSASHSLCDAVVHALLHSIAGNGCTGHAVDGAVLGFQQLLDQVILCGLTNGVGLTGQIQLDVSNGCLAEGGGHGDIAHALGRGSVGARGVLCSGRRCSRAAGSSIAGSQCTGGDAAHGSSRSQLQKAFARDLFHLGGSFRFSLSSQCAGSCAPFDC